MSTKIQKYILNVLLIVVIGLVELGLFRLICLIKPAQFYVIPKIAAEPRFPRDYMTLSPDAFTFIALTLIMAWLGILIGFYAWAIYHYNINLGKTNEEWEQIKIKENLKSLNVTEIPETSYPTENPYKEETFGLPAGTVRGTIALSMLVGGFALLILCQNILLYENTDALEKYLEYFKTAFMMMIAFYFGSQSLKYLKSSSPTPPSAPPKNTPNPTDTTTLVVQNPNESPKDSVVVRPVEGVITSPVPNSATIPEIKKAASQHQIRLTEEDIEKCAKENEMDSALIKAVISVESSGSGFLADGRPKILFEGYSFWKQLKLAGKKPEDYAATNPDLLQSKWTRQYYSKIGANEYLRLERAKKIDETSALNSTSWGLFQIMGFNHKLAGYVTVKEFVEAQSESEGNQLRSFIHFIKNNNGLLEDLKNLRWQDFARKYNGSGYEVNRYDTKLEDAYYKFLRQKTPNIKAKLVRTSQNDKETLGELTILNADRPIFKCKTLELPWKNNSPNVSCIPEGPYQVKKRVNEEFKNHFHLQDVPDRSYILVHAGNYYTDTRGCILVGKEHVDINNDGYSDVNASRDTLAKLNEILPAEFQITISKSA